MDSIYSCFFFQAEDGIRDLVRSRGLGDVYKRQIHPTAGIRFSPYAYVDTAEHKHFTADVFRVQATTCLLYTSDAADERSSVDLGGRRIIKKNT